MIFLISQGKHTCDPSLEPSHRDGSNDGPQICFYGKIWINIPKLSLLPVLIWRTAANSSKMVALVVLGLTALGDSISVYNGPSLKEGERKEK